MPSAPEEHFALLWQAAGGLEDAPPMETEFQFHPVRKWSADFAIPTKGVLFEIEGGVHSGGRHSRGTGFTNDAEKYLEATLTGWHVIRLVPSQLNLPTIERLLLWTQLQPNVSLLLPARSLAVPRGKGGSSLPSKRVRKSSAKN